MTLTDVSGNQLLSILQSQSLKPEQEKIYKKTERVGPYIVTIIIDDSGMYKQIESVSIDKSFLSMEQHITKFKYLDVEQYLEETE